MNRLSTQISPYLLQHKNNPVSWFPWADEAFETAKKENKPIFLSIGYSTCHWCHVMEKESFEDQEVADVLNTSFISIKVDREERPDVDKIYMDALLATTGQGGWPMSMFLTHDLKPFYGGTYFPKSTFIKILEGISNAWKKDFPTIQKTSEELAAHLNSQHTTSTSKTFITNDIFHLAFQEAKRSFDPISGGFGSAPKFPPSIKLHVLLQMPQNPTALQMVTHTLEQMMRGGIYDHLGGGFHRYSTDSQWLVPHFEKMLCDNALLSFVYLEAYQLTKTELFKEVAQEILDYVLREMRDSTGGFYSAQDADSEGREGTFYVWTQEELKQHLTPQEFNIFEKVYGVTPQGNFEEGTNILHLQKEYTWEENKNPLLKSAKQKLFSIRSKRIPPYKDDKILTDWNGLMIASLAKAYHVLQDKKYLNAAQEAAFFIQKHLFKDNTLLKRYRGGEAGLAGTLDDYAYVIYGLITLYEADLDAHWIQWTQTLQNIQDELFWDSQNGGYFFTAKNTPHLIRRSKEYHDDARPNSNAIAFLNLLKLYEFTFQEDYKIKSEKIMLDMADKVSQYPEAHAQALIAFHYFLNQPKMCTDATCTPMGQHQHENK